MSVKKSNSKKSVKNGKEVEITKVISVSQSGKKKWYLSYGQRLFLYFVFIVLLLMLSGFLIYNSISFQRMENVNYTEKGNIDYKVHLKENEFYEEEYLDENMSYVASLVNDIKVSFNYSFVIDRNIDLDVSYDIIAKLIISDSSDNTNFYEKDYVLLEEVKDGKLDIDHYTINKDVVIDYDYYNDIANKFKSQYDVSTNSYLQVYLNISKKSGSLNIKEPNSKLILDIPLSQRAINIKMDSSEFNNNETLELVTSNFKIKQGYNFVLGCVCVVVSLILLIRVLLFINKTQVKRSPYDKEVSKILREYDRFISIVKKMPNLDGYERTEIKSFYELLDIRDSLNKVIMFYEITRHQKCLFYLIDGNLLYVYMLKAVDIEDNK